MTDTDTTIVWSATGRETVTRMHEHASLVDAAWGRHRPDLARATSLSLARQLGALVVSNFGTGPIQVYRDGDLSLYVTAGIHFGIIFHPRYYGVDAPQDGDIAMSGVTPHRAGRFCHADVGEGYCLEPFRDGAPTCEGHDTVPVVMPVPGTWSFHS